MSTTDHKHEPIMSGGQEYRIKLAAPSAMAFGSVGLPYEFSVCMHCFALFVPDDQHDALGRDVADPVVRTSPIGITQDVHRVAIRKQIEDAVQEITVSSLESGPKPTLIPSQDEKDE